MLKFHELEENRVCKMHASTNLYKRYSDKFYWLSDCGWCEIRPNYEYASFVYLDEVLGLSTSIIS